MKKLFLLIALSFSLCANSTKLVTANEIVSFYGNYRNHQERLIESKIIKPRLTNFSKKLYLEVLKSTEKEKDIAVAYCAVLAIISHRGEEFTLPTKYESLHKKISREISLMLKANKRELSPIMGVWVDYTLFKIPHKYRNDSDYFLAMKFAQTMPFMINPSTLTKVTKKSSDKLLKTVLILKKAINASAELSNLYREINGNLNDFIGRADDFNLNDIENKRGFHELRAVLNRNPKCPVDSDTPVLLSHLNKKRACRFSLSIRLFPSRYTIDNYILANIPKLEREVISRSSFNDIIKAIAPNKKIKSRFDNHPTLLKKVHKHLQNAIITQNSSYDYDLKIMKRLIDANHIEAFKNYYKMVQKRAYLYKKRNRLVTKDIYLSADIEPNLSKTLSVMIEGVLNFSRFGLQKKSKTLRTLKRLREVALKKEQGIEFLTEDIRFLKSVFN
jgi:hypothetical protein